MSELQRDEMRRSSRPPRIPWHLRLLNGLGECRHALGLTRSRNVDQWIQGFRRDREGKGETIELPEVALRHFLSCLLEQGVLSYRGVEALWSLVSESLQRSQAFEQAIARGGNVQLRPISSPFLVLGLPRTGTTLLQRLLLQYPGSRWLRSWELSVPFPSEGVTWGGAGDSRKAEHLVELEQKRKSFADLDALHSLESPQECWPLVMKRFTALTPFLFFGLGRLPEFEERISREDVAVSYEGYSRYLSYLNAQEPSEHWVLKAPEHSFHLHALARVFPEGRYLQLHRSASETVVSMCALVVHTQRYFLRRLNPQEIGQQVLQVVCLLMDRTLAATQEEAVQVKHVAFRDLIGDPVGVVTRAYEDFGVPVGDKLKQSLTGFVNQDMPRERSSYHYDLEAFGLSKRGVQDAVGACYERAGADRALAE